MECWRLIEKLENILVHMMNGVIMYSEFEESVQPNEEEDGID